jgi:hypothetical protein
MAQGAGVGIGSSSSSTRLAPGTPLTKAILKQRHREASGATAAAPPSQAGPPGPSPSAISDGP